MEGGDCVLARTLLLWVPLLTLPSGTDAILYELFLLPNQLPLFFLDRLGLLSVVAGEPGLSEARLSDEDIGWRPRNLRTEDGRFPDGLVGDSVPLEVISRSWGPDESLDVVPAGKVADVGVGCESSGPLPGVGGRGLSGGESRGAGIEVPSVREIGVMFSVSGVYLPTAMVTI